jgi:hypothetical protein
MRKIFGISLVLGVSVAMIFCLNPVRSPIGKSVERTSEPQFFLGENVALPEVPDQLMVYRMLEPKIDAHKVAELAEILGLNGGVEEREERFWIGDGSFELDVKKATGYMFYADLNRMYTGGPILLSNEEAIELAENFLIEHGLMPPDAELRRTVEDRAQIARINPETGEVRIIESGSGVIQVWFGRRINGIPVVGEGCTLAVSIAGRDVVGVYKCWADYVPYKEFPTITPSEALERLKERGTIGWLTPVKKLEVRGVYLGYHAESKLRFQEYLKPVYVFEVDTGIGRGMIEEYVSAI